MTATSDTASSPAIRSLIPARIDRLPWSRFHTRMVTADGRVDHHDFSTFSSVSMPTNSPLCSTGSERQPH